MTKGALDPAQYQVDFHRICTQGVSRPVCTIRASSFQEVELLRYAFRVNSTKMRRSVWQSKNVPRGEISPWMATFIAPLSTEEPDFLCNTISDEIRKFLLKSDHNCDKVSRDSILDLNDSYVKSSPLDMCATCFVKKIKLKNCSRCKKISYCSLVCQKTHWNKHRFYCTSSCL